MSIFTVPVESLGPNPLRDAKAALDSIHEALATLADAPETDPTLYHLALAEAFLSSAIRDAESAR